LLSIKYLGINTLVHWFLFYHFQVVPAEASAEVTQNSDDGAEAAAPIPASSPKNKKKRKSGKTISSEDEYLNHHHHHHHHVQKRGLGVLPVP